MIRICRVCVRETKDYTPLQGLCYNKYLVSAFLKDIFNIIVKLDSEISVICNRCNRILNFFYRFYNIVQEAQQKFNDVIVLDEDVEYLECDNDSCDFTDDLVSDVQCIASTSVYTPEFVDAGRWKDDLLKRSNIKYTKEQSIKSSKPNNHTLVSHDPLASPNLSPIKSRSSGTTINVHKNDIHSKTSRNPRNVGLLDKYCESNWQPKVVVDKIPVPPGKVVKILCSKTNVNQLHTNKSLPRILRRSFGLKNLRSVAHSTPVINKQPTTAPSSSNNTPSNASLQSSRPVQSNAPIQSTPKAVDKKTQPTNVIKPNNYTNQSNSQLKHVFKESPLDLQRYMKIKDGLLQQGTLGKPPQKLMQVLPRVFVIPKPNQTNAKNISNVKPFEVSQTLNNTTSLSNPNSLLKSNATTLNKENLNSTIVHIKKPNNPEPSKVVLLNQINGSSNYEKAIFWKKFMYKGFHALYGDQCRWKKGRETLFSMYKLEEVCDGGKKWLLDQEKINDVLSLFVDMKCDLCPELPEFPSYELLAEHSFAKHNYPPKVTCCNESRVRFNLEAHILKKHILRKKDIKKKVSDAYLKEKRAREALFSKHKVEQICEDGKWLLSEDEIDWVLRLFVDMKCVRCEYAVDRYRFLAEHCIGQHGKDPTFDCCGESRTGDELKEHVLHKHILRDEKKPKKETVKEAPQKKKCPMCSKTVSLGSYKAHLVTHLPHDKRAVQCKLCHIGFGSQSGLRDHMEYKHSKKTFLCPECGKIFHSEMYLNFHRRRLHTPKIYNCDECDKKYGVKSLLLLHKRKKHGIPTDDGYIFPQPKKETELIMVKCSVCDSIIKKQSLYLHMMSHDPANKKKCPYCPYKSFFIRNHIQSKHLKTKRHLCHLCSHSFSNLWLLHDHIDLHHGGKKDRACQFCDEMFIARGQLMKHCRKKHLKEYREMKRKKLEELYEKYNTKRTKPALHGVNIIKDFDSEALEKCISDLRCSKKTQENIYETHNSVDKSQDRIDESQDRIDESQCHIDKLQDCIEESKYTNEESKEIKGS